MSTAQLMYFEIDVRHPDRLVSKSVPDDRVDELLVRIQSDEHLLPFVIRRTSYASPKSVVNAAESAFKAFAKAHHVGKWYPTNKHTFRFPQDLSASKTFISTIEDDVAVLYAEKVDPPRHFWHLMHFDDWMRRFKSRVEATEAAETRLWESVLEELEHAEAPERDTRSDDAAAFQQAVQRRDHLVASEKWLSSEQIALQARGAVVESNKDQYAYQLRQTGQILGVRHARKRLHPACQFHEVNGRLEPLPVMKRLLERLPKDDTGWDQAFWLFQPTGRLDGQRPADVLATRPDDVIAAAEKDFHGDPGI